MLDLVRWQDINSKTSLRWTHGLPLLDEDSRRTSVRKTTAMTRKPTDTTSHENMHHFRSFGTTSSLSTKHNAFTIKTNCRKRQTTQARAEGRR